MDVWGAGCVLFEITALFPLFPGSDEVDQINRIHKVVGTPPKNLLIEFRKNKSSKMDFKFREQKGVGIRHFIPHASMDCINLLNATLEYDFSKRIASGQAYNHAYFDSLRGNTKNTSKIANGTSSPTSVSNLYGKDSREEKPSLRTRKTEQKQNMAKKIDSRSFEKVRFAHRFSMNKNFCALYHHSPQTFSFTNLQPQTKPKAKPKPKYSYMGNKSLNQGAKSTVKIRARFGISKTKSEDSEASKPNRQRFNNRLPKLEKGNTNPKTDPKLGTKPNPDPSKPSNTARRRKKYANIASSGYGKTNYKPKMKAVNPSATSSLTDPTAKTSGGTSGYISSKSFGDDSKKKPVTQVNSSSARRQLAGSRKDKTLTKLPNIR